MAPNNALIKCQQSWCRARKVVGKKDFTVARGNLLSHFPCNNYTTMTLSYILRFNDTNTTLCAIGAVTTTRFLKTTANYLP